MEEDTLYFTYTFLFDNSSQLLLIILILRYYEYSSLETLDQTMNETHLKNVSIKKSLGNIVIG